MDRGIQFSKSNVHYWEKATNQNGDKLKQLESPIEEEGLFCVEWCVIMPMSTEGFTICYCYSMAGKNLMHDMMLIMDNLPHPQ